eukprot:119632-Prymnesium_polylepis.1
MVQAQTLYTCPDVNQTHPRRPDGQTSRRLPDASQTQRRRGQTFQTPRLNKVSAAAGAQRAPVAHLHPCTHEARQWFPRPRSAR